MHRRPQRKILIQIKELRPWNAARPGFGPLRRESGFSIASLAASLPVGRDRSRSFASTAGTTAEESGQMMVDVSSRPGSVRSIYGSDAESSREDCDEDEEEQDGDDDRHDVRSIRSFESMLGRAARRRRTRTRKNLSDRLASMSGLSRLSDPQKHNHSNPCVHAHFQVQSVNNRHSGHTGHAFATSVTPPSP